MDDATKKLGDWCYWLQCGVLNGAHVITQRKDEIPTDYSVVTG
jgi:hypothetical protein